MSSSNGGGKLNAESPKVGGSGAVPEEWPATRAVAREENDEWQATRALTRASSENEEWQATRVQPQPLRSAPTPDSSRPRDNETPDAWAQTRAQTTLATQLLTDENDYLATRKDEIGRQIGGNERELFVSCGPAEAMQQQFEHLQPEFIAVHDVATASSRKLLSGIAAASGQAVQKLVIRRQGYGTALATLEFVELPTSDGEPLRLYTTEADADTAARHALAKTLLAYSRLGVVMVGELPGHAIAAGAEAPARRHHRRPVAEPEPAAAAAGLGEHARHPRPRPRSRHRRCRAHDAASGPPGRCLGLHHRHLEPPARADARRRPRCPGARRLSRPPAYQPGRAPLATGVAAGDTRPMEDVIPTPVLALRPMPAILNPGIETATPATLLGRYVKQLSELNGVDQLLRSSKPPERSKRSLMSAPTPARTVLATARKRAGQRRC